MDVFHSHPGGKRQEQVNTHQRTLNQLRELLFWPSKTGGKDRWICWTRERNIESALLENGLRSIFFGGWIMCHLYGLLCFHNWWVVIEPYLLEMKRNRLIFLVWDMYLSKQLVFFAGFLKHQQYLKGTSCIFKKCQNRKGYISFSRTCGPVSQMRRAKTMCFFWGELLSDMVSWGIYAWKNAVLHLFKGTCI